MASVRMDINDITKNTVLTIKVSGMAKFILRMKLCLMFLRLARIACPFKMEVEFASK